MSETTIQEFFDPVGTRVLIKVDSVETTTKGGIVIPTAVADRETAVVERGIVEAIGEQAFTGFGDGKPWCFVGERVCFLRHAGQLYKVGNQDYRILNDVDIAGVSRTDRLNRKEKE